MSEGKHQKLFENLIKDSQQNTEALLETYFQTVNGEISDTEILKTLSSVSENLSAMQAEISHQLKSSKNIDN